MMSNEQALRVLQEALQVIEINHGWHKEYDDQDTYPGSDLYNQNVGAIREIKAALALPTSAPVDERESFESHMREKFGYEGGDFYLIKASNRYSMDEIEKHWVTWQSRATLPTQSVEGLPVLPEPDMEVEFDGGVLPAYSIALTQAYATAAVLAEREACAMVCESLRFTEMGPTPEAQYQRNLCAEAIRARKAKP